MGIELDQLIAGVQTYVVSPANAFGLGGYVFDVPGESMSKLEAEITDNYVEDNTAIQDHIARRPQLITLRGYVGELVYRPDGDTPNSILQTAVQKLTTVSGFLPTISTATQQLQTVVSDTNAGFSTGLSDAADLYGLVKNLIGSFGNMKNQQSAFQFFKACWSQGILMSIQTPWEFLTNMAIQSVVAIQGEGTEYSTDFAVTYKKMNFAKTISQAYTPTSDVATAQSTNVLGYSGNYPGLVPVTTTQLGDTAPIQQGVAALQAAPQVPLGIVAGGALPVPAIPGAQGVLINASDILSGNSGLTALFNKAAGN